MLYLKMRIFTVFDKRYIPITWPAQVKLGLAIQEENRDSPLENLHREMKALQDANNHLEVRWI